MSHFCIVGGVPRSLQNFQGGLIREIVSRGHRVTALSGPATADEVAAIAALGATLRQYPVVRTSMNPLHDLRTLRALRELFLELQPDVVMAYTIKPVIWGGLALRSLRGVRFFALITGLGYAFHGRGFARRGLTALVTTLYRSALARAETVVFHNQDNRDVFVSRRIIEAEKSRVGRGSGVDLEHFAFRPLPASGSVFLVIARLLGEKGLREYATAAKNVRARHPEATFQILGPADSSPDSIPLEEVQAWHDQGIIQYLGVTYDVRPRIEDCHIYVLPSYHEGMPRSVLEAMAMGRPILTTDVPGCRETVVPGENGFLVPMADVAALEDRLTWFLGNRDQWARMGLASRRMTEKHFDVHKINAEMITMMGLA